MNLNYKILWIDDNEDFTTSFDEDSLVQYMHEQGFDLSLEFRNSPDEISREVDGRAYDLLVIDYHITEEDSGKYGSDVIKSVRDTNCLTEVIFYSQKSASELRIIAANNNLEGVFFSTRDADALRRKISDVFDLTVRKVVDVNNMRGIVMAGVADLDHRLIDLLHAIHDKAEAEKKSLHDKKVFQRLIPEVKGIKKLVSDEEHADIEALKGALKNIAKLAPKDFKQLISLREFDSYKKVEVASSLCSDDIGLAPSKEKLSEIKRLLKWRNALAHQRPTINKQGAELFEPDEGTPEAFDDACTKELRKLLREHRKHLDALLNQLKD